MEVEDADWEKWFDPFIRAYQHSPDLAVRFAELVDDRKKCASLVACSEVDVGRQRTSFLGWVAEPAELLSEWFRVVSSKSERLDAGVIAFVVEPALMAEAEELLRQAVIAIRALDHRLFYERRQSEPGALLSDEYPAEFGAWRPDFTRGFINVRAETTEDGDWPDGEARRLLVATVFRDIVAVLLHPTFRKGSTAGPLNLRLRQVMYRLRRACDPAGALLYDNLCGGIHHQASSRSSVLSVWARQTPKGTPVIARPVSGKSPRFEYDVTRVDAKEGTDKGPDGQSFRPWGLWLIAEVDARLDVDAVANDGVVPGEVAPPGVLRRIRQSRDWKSDGLRCALLHDEARAEIVSATLEHVDARATVAALSAAMRFDVGIEADAIWRWARRRRLGELEKTAHSIGQSVRVRIRKIEKVLAVKGGADVASERDDIPTSKDDALAAQDERRRAMEDYLDHVERTAVKVPHDLAAFEKRYEATHGLVDLSDRRVREQFARRLQSLAVASDLREPTQRLATAVAVIVSRFGHLPAWLDISEYALRLGVRATDFEAFLDQLGAILLRAR